MLSFDLSIADPQTRSPLFSYIPGEIRNRIFRLATSVYCPKEEPYESNEYHYRPCFRYNDQKLDVALLRTCQRVYQETYWLAVQDFERVGWYERGPSPDRWARTYPKTLKHLHLFTQQYWLEKWDSSALELCEEMPQLQRIRITLRHSDWWYWENSDPLLFDPKQSGTASQEDYSCASDEFEEDSWGNAFHYFRDLKVLELELETVEGKRGELDAIVKRAPGWRFLLSNGNVLVLNQGKTRRTGWIGNELPDGEHIPNDPVEAKKRLVESGVDFSIPDGEPEMTGPDCLTYYVVTLAFEIQKATESFPTSANKKETFTSVRMVKQK